MITDGEWSWVLGPAANAARRARTNGRTDTGPARGYPRRVGSTDDDVATGDAIALAATRALLNVETRAEAALVLRTVVHDLGGAIVPARLAADAAIPVDVSLGEGEPQVVVVDPLSVAALRLTLHLPFLVQDALRTAARCENAQRQATRASVDTLTGVGTRGEIGPRLASTKRGSAICMLDLDGLKRLNDTRGHPAGDDALRAFGALLRSTVRQGDFCARIGGDEFLVILESAPPAVARGRMVDLVSQWSRSPWHHDGVGVSVGLGLVDDHEGPIATRAADAARYRAKRLGGNRVEVAGNDDYDAAAAT